MRPLGGSGIERIDFRLAVSTRRSLRELVLARKLREDLLYRVQGVELVVPPLRERREDIVLLVEHFLALECERTGRRVDLERKTIDRLLEYHWPGNVRELENEIRRLIVLGSGRIGPDDLAIPSAEKALEGALRPGALDGMTWVEAREALDRAFFQEALKRCKGSLAEVARYLGVHERSVYKLRRRLKLEP